MILVGVVISMDFSSDGLIIEELPRFALASGIIIIGLLVFAGEIPPRYRRDHYAEITTPRSLRRDRAEIAPRPHMVGGRSPSSRSSDARSAVAAYACTVATAFSRSCRWRLAISPALFVAARTAFSPPA